MRNAAETKTISAGAQLVRSLAFLSLVAAIYLASLWTSSLVRSGELTALQCLTRNYNAPGDRFQSLRRIREASERGKVDIVVFGSSHAYRSFDPRAFAESGHSLQNLGSTNQTPLNSYYLAEVQLPHLSPSLVIVEVYYQTLSGDGLESCRDLAVNAPASWPMTKMAFATWNLGAMSYAIGKVFGLTPEQEHRESSVGTYIPGGYMETVEHRASLAAPAPFAVDIRDDQLRYLAKLTALAKAAGARVVWVTHPLPEDHWGRVTNRAEIVKAIAGAAERSATPYWDFNETLSLDPLADFSDFHHLSASGVAKFDRALLGRLEREGLL